MWTRVFATLSWPRSRRFLFNPTSDQPVFSLLQIPTFKTHGPHPTPPHTTPTPTLQFTTTTTIRTTSICLLPHGHTKTNPSTQNSNLQTTPSGDDSNSRTVESQKQIRPCPYPTYRRTTQITSTLYAMAMPWHRTRSRIQIPKRSTTVHVVIRMCGEVPRGLKCTSWIGRRF